MAIAFIVAPVTVVLVKDVDVVVVAAPLLLLCRTSYPAHKINSAVRCSDIDL